GAATGYCSKKNYTYFATGQTYAGEGAEEGTGNSIHKKHVETDGLLVIENGVKTKTGKINSTIRDNYKANYFILVSGTTTSVPAAGYSYSSNYHGVTAAGIKEGKNSKSTDAGYRQSGPINGAPTTNTRTSGTDNVSETSSYETTDMIGVGSENSVSPGSSSNTDYVSGGWHKYNHTYIGSTTVTSNGALSGSISNIEKMQWTSFDRLDVDSTNMYGSEISTKIANGNQTTSVIDQGSIHGYVNDPRSTTTYTKTVVCGISWHKTGTMSFYGIILPINDSGYTDLSQPAIGPLTKESHPSPSIVDWVQLGIDTIDMFDPTGALSALNAVVYFARGKVSEGIASSIGAIPLVGRGGKYLAKAMIKGGKVTDDAGKVYKAVLVGNAALTGVSLALSQDSIRAGATEVWHGIQDIGAGSMKKGIYEIWHGTFAITSGIRGIVGAFNFMKAVKYAEIPTNAKTGKNEVNRHPCDVNRPNSHCFVEGTPIVVEVIEDLEPEVVSRIKHAALASQRLSRNEELAIEAFALTTEGLETVEAAINLGEQTVVEVIETWRKQLGVAFLALSFAGSAWYVWCIRCRRKHSGLLLEVGGCNALDESTDEAFREGWLPSQRHALAY
ncbi:MAG TPA: hypothetical protein PKA06_01660, partial [Gemmatales bacterium]|nr:hypothetical protein [Gemmatales bacterium]